MTSSVAAAMRAALSPAAWIYGRVIAARNRRFDRDPNAIQRAPLPVICVGNLTTGGSGKTPIVMEVARRLADADVAVAISTRGYGAANGHQPDEYLEFRAALPDVPVIVDADRVRAASAAAGQGARCLVMDDGFQHRRLHRDLDIVLVDALNPWGGGALLPAGRLREPLSALRRADLIVITRRNQATAAEIEDIEARIAAFAADTAILYCDMRAKALTFVSGEAGDLASLQTRSALPVCGIGNPATFVRLVGELCGRLAPPLILRDHHHYTPGDMRRIASAARAADIDLVLTTRKDFVKLAPLWRADPPAGLELAAVEITAMLDDVDDEFDAALQGVVELCEGA